MVFAVMRTYSKGRISVSRNHSHSWLLPLLLVPLDAILELDARTTKDIQCAANGQVDLAVAQLLH
jgi:hypothetical protein